MSSRINSNSPDQCTCFAAARYVRSPKTPIQLHLLLLACCSARILLVLSGSRAVPFCTNARAVPFYAPLRSFLPEWAGTVEKSAQLIWSFAYEWEATATHHQLDGSVSESGFLRKLVLLAVNLAKHENKKSESKAMVQSSANIVLRRTKPH